MVVEGQITNQEGPFQVKLTTTVPTDTKYYTIPVLFANVKIVDNEGKTFRLIGEPSGLYQTSEQHLKGIPGNTYTLYITTEDSTEYFSTPVQTLDVPEIDSLYFKQVQNIHFEAGKPVAVNSLNILLDSHDAEGKTKYWRFDYVETWQVNLTADAIKVQHGSINSSDFTYQFMLDTLVTFVRNNIKIEQNPKMCWVTKSSQTNPVATTANNPNDQLKGALIESIGPGDSRLHLRYSILVRQYALSQDLYDYWKQLEVVSENTGGIYEKIPASVFGNIISSNQTKKAVGYFAASSVKEKRFFILRSEHQVKTVGANSLCTYYDFLPPAITPVIRFGADVNTKISIYSQLGECADCAAYGTKVKPSFW